MNSDFLKNKFLSGDYATKTIFKMGDGFVYTETFPPGNYASRFLETGSFVRNAQFIDELGNKLCRNGQVQEIISRQAFIKNQWINV